MSTSSQPTQFGRYQLLELLAKGGMAEVFKARMDAAAGTEKLVCIKRILPHLSKNSEFISLFIREAKITLPLSHGNITQVFDFGEVDGLYFLAMEYIRGRNLAQMQQRLRETGQGLDVPTALWIGSELCRGLHYAHNYTDAKGKSVVVVHRDLSPHNVLISLNGEVKLTDFGIALAASKASEDAGAVRGKPCYVSPEQAGGQAADPRSDVFSMGSVLYEMLTGVRAFERESDAETLACVRLADPEPLREKLGEETLGSSHEEIAAIVLKALARDPQQRYQRAGDLQVALSRLLHNIAPDFTADRLSQSVKGLFGWELTEDKGDGARERLLYQLAQAGVDIEDRNAKTDELLQMGTVAIGAAAPKVVRPPDAERPPRAPWVVIALLAVLGGAFGLYSALASSGPHEQVDSGVNIANLPMADPTEHLTPPSLRERKPAVPAAPVSPTPASKAPAAAKANSQGRARLKSRRQVGYLNCNSWPWSVVTLNGRRLPGNTPIYRVKVAAGKHRLRFENPELRLSKELTVSVAPGSVKTVAVSLQQ
ncbi:MAG: serine/threonine protein kinase [Deltaproteobacteria bacterium]|nr:serine/threonine protein kinase [Deltaproteobacteria bacterium]